MSRGKFIERKTDGEITWDIFEVVEDVHTVTKLHFHKQTEGEFAGNFHPIFFQMLDGIFLSSFVEPEYKLWSAYLGDRCIGSNLVYSNGKLLSAVEGREDVDDFADEP